MKGVIWNMNGYIAHHGIKGQRWGVRRFQNSDGSLTNAGKARYGDSEGSFNGGSSLVKPSSGADNRSSWKSSGSSVKNLSDEELKARVNRLNMEKQYKQAMEELDPTSTKIKKVITDASSQAMTQVLKDVEVNIVGMTLNNLASDLGLEGNVVNTGLKTKNSNNDALDASKWTAKDSSKLSTAELKTRNDRLQAVETYNKYFDKKNTTADTSRDKWKADDVSKLSDDTLSSRNSRLKSEKMYSTYFKSDTDKKKKKENK